MTTVPPGSPTTDPRPALTAALDQTGAVLHAVRPDQLGLPTPCDEYDVRTLVGHLVAVARRVAHVGTGGDPFAVPRVVEGLDDAGAAWEAVRAELDKVWSDDAVLDRMLRLPWGQLPGRAAALAYVQEFLVHGWDLAMATDQRDRLDDALAEPCVGAAQRFVPAEPRGGEVPFGPVRDVAADARPYERLAAWLGRDPHWTR